MSAPARGANARDTPRRHTCGWRDAEGHGAGSYCARGLELGRDCARNILGLTQEHRPAGAAISHPGQHILLELAAQTNRADRDPFGRSDAGQCKTAAQNSPG